MNPMRALKAQVFPDRPVHDLHVGPKVKDLRVA